MINTENKKEILIFSSTDLLGGAENVLFNLAINMNATQVFILGFKKSDKWENAGFKVKYFNGSFLNVIKSIRKYKFNIVVSSHLIINSLLGVLRFLGILKTDFLICRESTSIMVRYSGIKKLKYKLYYWLGYRRIDLLITQTDFMKDVLLEELPYIERRCSVKTISNFFVSPSIINNIKVFDSQFIVGAGRLIHEKGFDILIESFKMLHYDFPELKLIILGEGTLREQLETLIRDSGLNDYVLLIGFVDDVYFYFKQASLCVVSSRIEGFPNVLLQMMSQNTKVVSTLCAGGIDMIKGLEVCIPNDPKDLYNSMKRTIINNTSLNRIYFDEELEKRSINNYLESIYKYIDYYKKFNDA